MFSISARLFIQHFDYTMPTELPYAADAEMSLNYDELEVCRRLLSSPFTHSPPFARFYEYSIRKSSHKIMSLSRPNLITHGV